MLPGLGWDESVWIGKSWQGVQSHKSKITQVKVTQVVWMAWGKGDLIFDGVSPWVAVVVNAEAKRRCQGCFLPRAPDPDIECPNCLLVCYCSWACRAKDLRHKAECALLGNAGRLPDRLVVGIPSTQLAQGRSTGDGASTWEADGEPGRWR